MKPEEKEIQAIREEIVKELRVIFKANMKIFNWDIPENNDDTAAQLILDTMQEALDELKDEVKAGKYKNY